MEYDAVVTEPKDFVKPLNKIDEMDQTSILEMIEEQKSYQRTEERGTFRETALKNNFDSSQFFLENGAERDFRFGLLQKTSAEVTSFHQRSGLFASLKASRALLNSWVQRSQGRRQLSTMNEIALKDIGTNRVEAKVEVNKWFWQN